MIARGSCKATGMTGGHWPVNWFHAPGATGLARQVCSFFGSPNTKKGVWETLNLLEGR